MSNEERLTSYEERQMDIRFGFSVKNAIGYDFGPFLGPLFFSKKVETNQSITKKKIIVHFFRNFLSKNRIFRSDSVDFYS